MCKDLLSSESPSSLSLSPYAFQSVDQSVLKFIFSKRNNGRNRHFIWMEKDTCGVNFTSVGMISTMELDFTFNQAAKTSRGKETIERRQRNNIEKANINP